MNDLLTRRDVIKTILVTTAYSLIGNKAWAARTVSEVSPSIDPNVGVARITLASFPALNSNGGSVRLGSSSIRPDQEGPSGLYYPIIINRISATEYVALDSQCTHEGGVVGAYGATVASRMKCPLHDSLYDIRGVVQPGSEASFNLLDYPTSLSNGVLAIQMQDFGFSTTQTSVLNGAEKRLQLSWQSVSSTEYEVRHRVNLDASPTVVPFSTTLTGNPTSTFVTSSFFGGLRSVYVIPQDGIYQIAIRLRTM